LRQLTPRPNITFLCLEQFRKKIYMQIIPIIKLQNLSLKFKEKKILFLKEYNSLILLLHSKAGIPLDSVEC